MQAFSSRVPSRMFPDLRSFMDRLRADADMVTVTAPVDAHLEVAEIHRRVIAAGGPALLFTNVRERDFPLATNLFGTARRAELAFGDSARLDAQTNVPDTDVASWLWSPTEGLSCADCREPWAKPFKNMEYSLVMTDQNGCTARASVEVRVKRDRAIYAPNAISPDGDNFNDAFTIFGKGIVSIKNLRVYDRWGNAIFWGKDLPPNVVEAGWKGDFRGKAMNPGVFVWYAEIEWLDGGKSFESGDVLVLGK